LNETTKRCGMSKTESERSSRMLKGSCGRRGLMALLKTSLVESSIVLLHV